MLNWWMNLSARGKFYFWGGLGIGANGILFLMGGWMPIIFFISVGLILIGFLLPKDL